MTRVYRLIALCLAVMVPVSVNAGEATGTFRVSLTVVASCNVQTQPLAFANYVSGGSAAATASNGSIDVSCTKGTPASVFLDGTRTLTGPNGNQVSYTLQANGQAWSAGQSVNVVGQGSTPVHLSISGSVPAGQQIALGQYADEEVVRVIY
jgi:spore coat protein U-like protein